jgi:aryl-alcohol dehydrogenase-like predicted oxidoreductase
MFIITKVGLSNTDGIKINDINSFGVSRMNLFNSVESSLKRLQTTYIDMLQLQAWDPTCNVYEVVKCLDELVKSGKVRYFGVIGFKGYQLQKILDAARYATSEYFFFSLIKIYDLKYFFF